MCMAMTMTIFYTLSMTLFQILVIQVFIHSEICITTDQAVQPNKLIF